MDHRGLRADRDRARLQHRARLPIELPGKQRLDRAKQRDADEREHFRFVAADLPIENLPAFHVFSRPQVVDPRTRSRDQVRDPKAELGQPLVVEVCNRLRRQSGFRQQLPEAVRVSREVMTGLCGPHTGIDPDEKHAHARLDAVREAKAGPIHETIQP